MNKDILDIAKTLLSAEDEAKRRHWAEVSRKLEGEKLLAETYDLKEILESNFKRQRKHILETTLKFALEIKPLFEDGEAHPISFKNNWYSSFKERNFYKHIDNLLVFKLISPVSIIYDSRTSTSKTYRFNFSIFNQFLKQTSLLYHIIAHNGETKPITYRFQEETDKNDELSESVDFDVSRLRICSRMRMDITEVSQSAIIKALEKRYPQVPYYSKLIEKLNEGKPDEEKIRFRFNLKIKWRNGRKYLTKIGFRATSGICSYKEHENENPYYFGIWRKDFLKNRFGTEDYHHYDVNGSIYRLTYNLNHDMPYPFDKDIYEAMHGAEFKTETDRKAFKRICMRLMFGYERQIGSQIERKLSELTGRDYDRNEAAEIQEFGSKAKRNLLEALGGSYGSEIFLHESCVMLELLSVLSQPDIIIMIYDSLYFNSDIPNHLIDKAYLKAISSYRSRFSNTFTKSSLLYHIIAHNGENRRKNHVRHPENDIPARDPLEEKARIYGLKLKKLVNQHVLTKREAELIGEVLCPKEYFTEPFTGTCEAELFEHRRQRYALYSDFLKTHGHEMTETQFTDFTNKLKYINI